MWTQLLAYPVNAGLLALQTIGYVLWSAWQAIRHHALRQLTPAHRVLLLWLIVWLVVFTIPSQRSERYVIPAMPALAIGMALAWDRIPRLWSLAGLLLVTPALLILGASRGMSERWHWRVQLDAGRYSAHDYWFVHGGAGLLQPRWTRNSSVLACLAVYAVFGCMVVPLSDGYSELPAEVRHQLRNQRIAVPNGFTGQFESYHFTFPGAQIAPYDAEGRNTGERYRNYRQRNAFSVC